MEAQSAWWVLYLEQLLDRHSQRNQTIDGLWRLTDAGIRNVHQHSAERPAARHQVHSDTGANLHRLGRKTLLSQRENK